MTTTALRGALDSWSLGASSSRHAAAHERLGSSARLLPAPNRKEQLLHHLLLPGRGAEPDGARRRVQCCAPLGFGEEVVVVGDQPTISPGESFSYESGCPLSTPSGIMRGHYNFRQGAEDDKFMVAIPAFSLDSEYEHSSVN